MSDKTVLALGFFDGVHKGHRKVIEKAVGYARKTGAIPVVVSFDKPYRKLFGEKDFKTVYSISQRKKIIESLGGKAYFIKLSKRFLRLDRKEFLSFLEKKFSPTAFFIGKDYSFGKDKEGTPEYLSLYAEKLGKECVIVSDETVDGEKISTSKIKEHLLNGNIERANLMLGEDYRIEGRVIHGKRNGTLLGFKTANVKPNKSLISLKNGVYYGKCEVSGKTYNAVINVGTRPTFNDYSTLIEGHLIDFCGNLYGRKITFYIVGKIRDTEKFSDILALKERLKKDVEFIKEKL